MHAISAAALATAQKVLNEYWLEVRPHEEVPVGWIPNLKNTATHIAVVIDYATNIYKVAELRLELGYWFGRLQMKSADAAGLEQYLRRVITTFSEVPQYRPDEQRVVCSGRPVSIGPAPPQRIELTKAALETRRYLKCYYAIKPYNRGFDPATDDIRLAQLAEMGLGLHMAKEAEPLARLTLDRLKNNLASPKEIRRRFRELGVLLEYLPNFRNRQEETKLFT